MLAFARITLAAALACVRCRVVIRKVFWGSAGAAFYLSALPVLAPLVYADQETVFRVIWPGFALSLAFQMLFNAIGPSFPEWRNSELATLRQLAAAGWVVVPDDGHYTGYGPGDERRWFDHWREVEELLCTLSPSL